MATLRAVELARAKFSQHAKTAVLKATVLVDVVGDETAVRMVEKSNTTTSLVGLTKAVLASRVPKNFKAALVSSVTFRNLVEVFLLSNHNIPEVKLKVRAFLLALDNMGLLDKLEETHPLFSQVLRIRYFNPDRILLRSELLDHINTNGSNHSENFIVEQERRGLEWLISAVLLREHKGNLRSCTVSLLKEKKFILESDHNQVFELMRKIAKLSDAVEAVTLLRNSPRLRGLQCAVRRYEELSLPDQ
ncbi:MAG: hypothetical protein Q7S22_00015 [Candidatus Micrarchaeota archaeon]|nr:hypothetical protein [Candidatus Micrarchaeota archaeon]